MGGYMGCSVAMAFAVAYPAATRSMILFWPVGGAMYRMTVQQRFAEHLAYVAQNGLPAVVALALQSEMSFGADPRPTRRWTSSSTGGPSRAWRTRCSTATPRRAARPKTCCAEYWDVPVAQQTSTATNARILAFLQDAAAG
jgi:hypothetical protein